VDELGIRFLISSLDRNGVAGVRSLGREKEHFSWKELGDFQDGFCIYF